MHGDLGHHLPLASALPFAALLLCIAAMPLVAAHWWENNRNRAMVAAGLAIPFAVWFVASFGEPAIAELKHAGMEYVSFILLLGSLYVLSGGIYLRGSLAGTPLANTALLAIGALIANLVGTTGASMLLIRPLLRANKRRHHKVHLVIFFIFVVSNCGGLLTPLGDPPLYLGFLKGVPFEWTLSLWREWALVNGLLLVVFNALDQYMLNRDEAASRKEHLLDEVLHHERMGVEGVMNLALLVCVLAVVLAKGKGLGSGTGEWPFGVQEALLLALSVVSYKTTAAEVHHKNHFSFDPITEVAILFGGIFVTMVAPLLLLNAHGHELGLALPWHYFWSAGVLSSFLDNAPTYLTFASAAAGEFGIAPQGKYLGQMLAQHAEAHTLLQAISCGAVMMGAVTYIGNGPNFMVKAIAEHQGVKMPGFFGYMVWSGLVLLPIFGVVTRAFFWPM